jgi:hypothetical protein
VKDGNWIALHKELVSFLPHDRPYTLLEAMFSYSYDVDNGYNGTINGYAKLWSWSRTKVRKLLTDLKTPEKQSKNRARTGKEHLILLKLNNLQLLKNRRETGEKQERNRGVDTTIYPNPNPNPNPRSKPSSSELKKPVSSKAIWPEDDIWLKDLVTEQTFFTDDQKVYLTDHEWWIDMDGVLSGAIEPKFLEKQFLKMKMWKKDNGKRWPGAKGIRRFTKSWLEKAKEEERRKY